MVQFNCKTKSTGGNEDLGLAALTIYCPMLTCLSSLGIRAFKKTKRDCGMKLRPCSVLLISLSEG